MAKTKKTATSTKFIDQYEHKDKVGLNNPPVGLVDAHTDNGGYKKKTCQYDPHLESQLQRAGKVEHTSFDVLTVSLHVHERIDPRRIKETVKKAEEASPQMSLFEEQKKPLRVAIEFYKHKENWSNRLIAGGFDYYNPKTGTVDSGGKGDIAMWMLDIDYDGKNLFPSQVFFPMAGAKEGWATLTKNLKAKMDEEKIEAFGATISLPFIPGKNVAVKIIDARGIESLKIIRL